MERHSTGSLPPLPLPAAHYVHSPGVHGQSGPNHLDVAPPNQLPVHQSRPSTAGAVMSLDVSGLSVLQQHHLHGTQLRPLSEAEASIGVGHYVGFGSPSVSDGQRRGRPLTLSRGQRQEASSLSVGRLTASTCYAFQDVRNLSANSQASADTAKGLEEEHQNSRLYSGPLGAAVNSLSLRLSDSSLLLMGPAAGSTTTQAPSLAFVEWWKVLERRAEEHLLHEARRKMCSWAGTSASLTDFRCWLNSASFETDDNSLRTMRRAQVHAWLLVVGRRRRRQVVPYREGSLQPIYIDGCLYGVPKPESLHLPSEVRDNIEVFIGGKHVWGPINASRARMISEAAVRPLRRCEEILHAAAVASLVARYVHPHVVQAAEAGHAQCNTEIPTDDIAMRALFEGSGAETHQEIGTLLSAHLGIDGFQVEPKYHDPEYGLWRGFWVEKCNRLRLSLMW
mmetsp:Transcript_29519/g.97744  ORF Transcript_29519/g.97744 Transcript_29519/m.97744 type:complete len:450 (+) Transcript_29519:182-1531(+)